MRHFYFPSIEEDRLKLSPEESKHCIRVLRMKAGDEVVVTDGKGHSANATLLTADPSAAVLEKSGPVTKKQFPGIKLNLAIAVPRHPDRFEWLLEKATECGVYKITPVITTRSETRGSFKRSRFEKILLAAMKQSLRYHLPELAEPVPLKKFIEDHPSGLIAWCGDDQLPTLEKLNISTRKELNILIGPEGDFTEEEFQEAIRAGYQGLSLGPYRLRTETAALAACILVKLAYEKA